MGLRFEYRRFDAGGEILSAWQNALPRVSHKQSSETYTLFQNRSDLNIKIRNRRIDIKELLTCKEGLQQWRPLPPLQTRLRLRTLAAVHGLDCDISDIRSYLYACKKHPGVSVTGVTKERTIFYENGVTFEYVQGVTGQRPFTSVAVESEDTDALKQACGRFDLCKRPNQSYPTFLLSDQVLQPSV
ncbi:MAG: hypothetical protein ACQERK_07030 [Campylobacterota bacterium]